MPSSRSTRRPSSSIFTGSPHLRVPSFPFHPHFLCLCPATRTSLDLSSSTSGPLPSVPPTRSLDVILSPCPLDLVFLPLANSPSLSAFTLLLHSSSCSISLSLSRSFILLSSPLLALLLRSFSYSLCSCSVILLFSYSFIPLFSCTLVPSLSHSYFLTVSLLSSRFLALVPLLSLSLCFSPSRSLRFVLFELLSTTTLYPPRGRRHPEIHGAVRSSSPRAEPDALPAAKFPWVSSLSGVRVSPAPHNYRNDSVNSCALSPRSLLTGKH